MKKIFAANWKLNKSPNEARKFISDFKSLVANGSFYDNKEVLIFPSAFSLEALATACADSKIEFGPQNIYSEKSGAFTGENSAEVAQQLGSDFILIGHSERRQIFKEIDSQLNARIKLAHSLVMTPVYCIGETLDQREDNQTEAVCFKQLEQGLAGVDTQARIVVAYEPIWAIGTGRVATPAQVADTHLHLNKKMKAMGFVNFQLLYGGSVKPDNAAELLKIPHVDGFLIGGAALDPQSFFKICNSN